ncbi:MAG: hypothetical protein E7163_00850 [Firmicutes bacterium]|nr:hypothetical protein [Bacillota bacterium]
MKRIIMLIVLLGVCGCSAEYNININKDNIEEVIKLQALNNEDEIEYYNSNKNSSITPYFGTIDKFYDISFDDNIRTITLKYIYDDNIIYSYSKAFEGCFENSNIVTNESNEIIFQASGFLCQSYDYTDVLNLNVNVTVDDYDVVKHNANNVKNNIYSWNMVNGNFPDIYLKIKDKKNSLESENQNKCQLICSENEELINPNSEDCYCKFINNNTNSDDENNSFLDYILLAAVLLLFMIGIIGLIKYKSINKEG